MKTEIDADRLATFVRYFGEHPGKYVVIGGTACRILLSSKGLPARGTKDIDMILFAEALSTEYVATFWRFIRDGGYDIKERTDGSPKKYRFTKPSDQSFPYMIELFSRGQALPETEAGTIVKVVAPDGLSDLSAILMDDVYYHFATTGVTTVAGISVPSTLHLIALKALAYLNNLKDLHSGRLPADKERDAWKHADDIVDLADIVEPDDRLALPPSIRTDFEAARASILMPEPGNGFTKTAREFRNAFDILDAVYQK